MSDCPIHGPRPHHCNGVDWPTKPEPSAPRCEHKSWSAEDEEKDAPVPTGPRCEAVAEFIECGAQRKVCAKHKCRHNTRIEPSAPLDVGARRVFEGTVDRIQTCASAYPLFVGNTDDEDWFDGLDGKRVRLTVEELPASPPTDVDRRLDEVRGRAEKATPGKWFLSYCHVSSAPVVKEYDRLERLIPPDAPDSAYDHLPETQVANVPASHGDTPGLQAFKDGDFIAHARDDIPWLLSLVDELRRR